MIRARGKLDFLLWRLLLVVWAAQVLMMGIITVVSESGQWLAWREFRRQAADNREIRDIPYSDAINRLSMAAGINPAWVAAVIGAESSFNPHALSTAGAYGLMQVSPPTWKHVNERLKVCRDRHAGDCTAACYFDPELNLQIGIAYLAELMQKYRDPVLATAAYNAGPGAVDRAGGVPAIEETQKYVVRVASLCNELTTGRPPGPATFADVAIHIRELLLRLSGLTLLLLLATAVRLRVRQRSWRWR